MSRYNQRAVMCILSMIGMAACQSDGADATTRYSIITDELTTLAAQYDAEGYSELDALPTSGSSMYAGYVSLQLGNTTDAVADAIAGELNLTADFGGSDFSISGSAYSFSDPAGNDLSGSLTLGNASLDRNGDPATDATLSFDAMGVLTDHLNTEISMSLLFEGDFFGAQHTAIAGGVAGQATTNVGQQSVNGLFIAETIIASP